MRVLTSFQTHVCVCCLWLPWAGFSMPFQFHRPSCDALVFSCPRSVQAFCCFDVDSLYLYISDLFLIPLLTLRLLCHNCPMPRYVCKSLGTYVKTTVHAWRLQLSQLHMFASYTSMCLHRCQMVCGKTIFSCFVELASSGVPCHLCVQASTSAELKTIAF